MGVESTRAAGRGSSRTSCCRHSPCIRPVRYRTCNEGEIAGSCFQRHVWKTRETGIGHDCAPSSYGGGEGGLTKNSFFHFKNPAPAYRILHHTLIKHRETMISISK